MKHLLFFALMSSLLLSCKKEVPNSTDHSDKAEMVLTNIKTEIKTGGIGLRTDQVQYITNYDMFGKFYNICTGEDVVISGPAIQITTITVKNDTLMIYDANFNYIDVKGIGAISNKVYSGYNKISVKIKSILDSYGHWQSYTINASGNLMFSTPNAQSYVSSAYYHSFINSAGILIFDKTRFDFQSCK